MSTNKKKYVRTRKEVTVSFVDDKDVQCVKEKECGKESGTSRGKPKTQSDANVRVKRSVKKPDTEELSSSDEDTAVDKPLALFQDGDVPGKVVFGFHTPKRKNAMAEKAVESAEKRTPVSSCASPRTPSSTRKMSLGFTPRARRSIALNLISESGEEKCRPSEKKASGIKDKGSSVKKDNPVFENKTPYSLRARLKSRIAAQVERTLTETDSEDDYVPSDLEEEEDDDSDKEGNSDDSSEDLNKSSHEIRQISSKNLRRDSVKVLPHTPLQKRKQKDLIYAITVDEYFNSNSGKKNKTSNHTLNKLKNPKLEQNQLSKLLENVNSRSTHLAALNALQMENYSESLFEKWCFCLKEGYSILLYGLGSKRKILNAFHQNILPNNNVLVINGFFPGLSIKEIVDSLAGELLNIKDIPSQIHEVIELIESKLYSRKSLSIFLIIHNLDGIMLRCEKAQAFLSRLASIPKCYLLASVDHINAPLLWNDKKLSEYNFIWEDVTSFSIYTEETSFENSLLVQRSGTLVLASLKNVYQSLTKNGKEIFKILLNDCLENKNNHKYTGIGFSDLYWRCRDNFLVSTDLALRSQLTEFLDHQLVKWRKDSDHLVVPVDTSVLEQFRSLLEDTGE